MTDLETNVTISAQNKHLKDSSNDRKCPVDTAPNKKYKIINGIVIPTLQTQKNWRSYGFGVNCSQKVSDYINENVTTINFTMWRGDGVGEKLKETMKFIAISLLNPSKYHYYYFPFLFFSQFWTNKCTDLQDVENFINIGYNERNIFTEPCHCCVWGMKLIEIDPFVQHAWHTHDLLNETVRKYLRLKYFQNKPNLAVYDYQINNMSVFNVAVHIRRGENLSTGIKRKLSSDNYYIQIMEYLFGYKTKMLFCFHIYTQWGFDLNNFENVLKQQHSPMYNDSRFKLKYHIDTPLNLTFHGMVTADAFIGSRSTLSWTAAVLSSSKYIFMNTWGDMLNDWIRCTKRAKCFYTNGTRIL
eukprot:424602_1